MRHYSSPTGTTFHEKRDKTMHTKVLETTKYPTFVFRAESLEGEVPDSGSGEVTLHGILAIHGEEHPFSLPAEIEVEGGHISASLEFEIPFVEGFAG